MRRSWCFLPALLLLATTVVAASPYENAVLELDHAEMLEVLSEDDVARLLGGFGSRLNDRDRRAAATLVAMGVIDPIDLRRPAATEQQLKRYLDTMRQQHPDLLGRIGDAGLQLRLREGWTHAALLSEQYFLQALGEQLAGGVITGYDLRRKGVYDSLPAENTFIYSHSSETHLRQLATLMSSQGLDAWFYVTPKVSAFVFRDDWGTPDENVVALGEGTRIMRGKELAVALQFEDPDDRLRFHQLVMQSAKKDEKDEQGLIADAWWQPFYYTATPLDGFKPIALILLSRGEVEATLTVPEEHAGDVVAAFDGGDFEMRQDRVWVNPPFFRFLNGGYR